MVRAFLALELSEEIRSALAASQDILRRCNAELTFVNPAQIHITIKFLGEVEEQRIPLLTDALRTITFTPFVARAGRVTVNNPRRPFTVWSVIDDRGNGAVLRNRIEDLIAPLGFPRESRPFTAHATIARVRRYDPSLLETLKTLGDCTYGESTILSMKLKKSTLSRTGPLYEDLLEVPA